MQLLLYASSTRRNIIASFWLLLFLYSPSCRHIIWRIRRKEFYMITLVKWIVTALVAGFLWLIGKYTAEYFGPYTK